MTAGGLDSLTLSPPFNSLRPPPPLPLYFGITLLLILEAVSVLPLYHQPP